MEYSKNEQQMLIERLIKDCETYNHNEKTLKEGSEILNEGVWEDIKYGLSRLGGRYKAGGKIFGKSKTDAAAAEQIKAILDKKGNEMIAALDAKIKEIDPRFPNNRKEAQFLQIVEAIASVYDSIVAATKLSPKQKGYLPVKVANPIIEDLAVYVKKFLDVDITAAYSTMDEEELNEVAYQEPDPNHPKPVVAPAAAAPAAAPAAGGDAADAMRAQLQGKTPTGGVTRDSQRMETLKSNKLPLVLAGMGAALGALGWLAQTDWLKNIILDILGRGSAGADAVTQTIDGGAPDSRGFIHWASKIMGKPITNGAGVQEFVDKYGINNVQNMFSQNGAGTVQQQGQQLLHLIGGDGAHKTVGQLFNADTFGDMKMGRNLFGVSKMGKFVVTTVVKQAIKATAGAGAGVAATVAGIGSVLVPLGIGLVASGALVKLMRMKGQKQSRASTLNDLLQSIQPLKPTDGGDNIVPIPKPIKIITIEIFYIYLYRFFLYLQRFDITPVPEPTGGGINKGGPVVKRVGTGRNTKMNQPIANWQPSMDESLDEEMNLDEGAYIKNPTTLQYLGDQLTPEAVKKFEGFLIKLATVKNAIKKMQDTGINEIDGEINKLRTNPLTTLNFRSLFITNDKNELRALKDFIQQALTVLSSSKSKYGNLAVVKEAVKPVQSASASQEIFLTNLEPFIASLAKLYPIVQANKDKGKAPEEQSKEVVQEIVNKMNEQAEKMRHLMNFNMNTKRVL